MAHNLSSPEVQEVCCTLLSTLTTDAKCVPSIKGGRAIELLVAAKAAHIANATIQGRASEAIAALK